MIISIFLIIALLIVLFMLLLIIEGLISKVGADNDYKNPNRNSLQYGKGKNVLNYLVLGDSTAAGVGGTYDKGIAVLSANYLGKDKRVLMNNFAISGARVKDVLNEQIKQVKYKKIKPDIVLISVGGNDVTHITSLKSLEKDLIAIIDLLIKINYNVKIILTGAPNLGTSKRLLEPLRFIAQIQSKRVNKVFDKLIIQNKLTLAPIFKDTTIPFKKDASLFYKDKFHPNNKGYAIWTAIINKALDDAINN